MSNAISFLSFLVLMMIMILAANGIGADNEMQRIKQKCLIEMQEKPHKEAMEICKERVK